MFYEDFIMRLENKVVIITGGNSCVGEVTTKLFAKEGATVIISARRKYVLSIVEMLTGIYIIDKGSKRE